jgi:pyridinium-3,5-bisthiocarboxylic acid mononucleotide nickel chelatase
MKNKLYLECYSGISGDMMVAALLDLGADSDVLNKALQSLPIHGFQTQINRVKKAGLDACDFDVILDEEHQNHDHDMQYLHGESYHHDHDTGHHREHPHTYMYDSGQPQEHAHAHEHRGLAKILEIINQGEITNHAKELAIRIFNILSKAEAKAHGVEIQQVHFHEVGAIDSIVDIVAVAVCIDNLGIDDVIVPVLYEGTGFVRCQHGVIPIPVPAVSSIVVDYGLVLHIINAEGEFVTPTGAAIVAALKTSSKLPDKYTIFKIGLGAGKRNYERASILRAMLVQEEEGVEKDSIIKLESNIDDSSGEVLGYVMDKLFEAGARDVHYIPVFMKKNRPAYQISVVCSPDDVAKLEQIIFEETTTLGIRRQKMECSSLKRTSKTVETSLGKVYVKQCALASGIRMYPEYSSVIELCRKHNKSFQNVYQLILNECYGQL